jgi:hypothetical protein
MKNNQKGFGAVELVLILVALGLVGFAGWYVYSSKQNADSSYDKAANSSIVAKGETSSAAKKQAAGSGSQAAVVISDSLKENTAAAIESQNTAALEGYMADSVTVVVAASEKGGSETSLQAVKDLDYLNSGTSPWDFNLPIAALTAYKSGDYKRYFGSNTIVGKSANGYVVAFGVNNSGKIDTVFMAANSSLLE